MKEKNTQSTGNLGEDIAARYLFNKGYSIVSRNYRKPYGEIDIICTKDQVLHFIEVKSVSRLTSAFSRDSFRPEDNVHSNKLSRLSRVMEVYLSEYNIELDWQFDVITVIIDKKSKVATVKLLSDLVITK